MIDFGTLEGESIAIQLEGDVFLTVQDQNGRLCPIQTKTGGLAKHCIIDGVLVRHFGSWAIQYKASDEAPPSTLVFNPDKVIGLYVINPVNDEPTDSEQESVETPE